MKKTVMFISIVVLSLSLNAQIKQDGSSLIFDLGKYQVNDSLTGFWKIPYENEIGEPDTIYGYSKEMRDILMPDYWNGFYHKYANGIEVAYSLIDSSLYFKAWIMQEHGERIYLFGNPIITGYEPINLDSIRANTVIIND